MCNGQDAWLEEMVKVMVECCEPNDHLRDKPENGWFYKDYFWPMRNGEPRKDAKNEVKTIETFSNYSAKLSKSLEKIQNDQDIHFSKELINLGICINEIVVKL